MSHRNFKGKDLIINHTYSMVLKRTIKSLGLAIFMVGILASNVSYAQVQKYELIEDYELSLDEAIKLAVANSPQVKRALLSLEDADQLVKIAYSDIYPDISSSINYTRNVEEPVTYFPNGLLQLFGEGDPNQPPNSLLPFSFSQKNSWRGGFTATQTLFQGETIVGLSSAAIFKTVQKENLRAVSQQIITQTRIAYYSVLAANEQLRLQQAQIKRLEQNLAENQSRQKAGLVDSYDVLRIEVQLSNQKPLLIEAEYAVLEAYRNLKMLMGIPLQMDFTVLGSLNEFDILSKESTANANIQIKQIDQLNLFEYQKSETKISGLEETRGDLRLLDASLDFNSKEITGTKSRFLPSLSATYNLQWNADEPDSPTFFEDANRFQTLGLNLSLPLFQGFKRVADVQRVQIARKDLLEQKRAVGLQAENEVASASEDLNMAFETAEARKIALRQATEGYSRAQKRLESGLGSQLEVTEAEVQVRQAEVNYALMVFNYLTAKAQYDLATGIVPFVDTEPTQN